MAFNWEHPELIEQQHLAFQENPQPAWAMCAEELVGMLERLHPSSEEFRGALKCYIAECGGVCEAAVRRANVVIEEGERQLQARDAELRMLQDEQLKTAHRMREMSLAMGGLNEENRNLVDLVRNLQQLIKDMHERDRQLRIACQAEYEKLRDQVSLLKSIQDQERI